MGIGAEGVAERSSAVLGRGGWVPIGAEGPVECGSAALGTGSFCALRRGSADGSFVSVGDETGEVGAAAAAMASSKVTGPVVPAGGLTRMVRRPANPGKGVPVLDTTLAPLLER